MINTQFWHGKKVLITGCSGFKGSWLTVWLNMLKSKVYGYSLDAPTVPSMWDNLNIASLCEQFKCADIRDYIQLRDYIANIKPDIIIHMAAQSLVRYSYLNPRETYEVNVMGTVNLFESIRELGLKTTIINVTTDKCYENKEWLWAYRENDRLGGHDPYSNSKGCSELVTASYYNSYFKLNDTVSLASARAGNVIGGGDFATDRLIPDIVKSFNNGDLVNIRYPNAIRPWQYVLEPLSGYLVLAEKLYTNGNDYAGGWNFGPIDSDAKTVEWITHKVSILWENNPSWSVEQNQPHEANSLRLDCSKARELLKWSPVWDLDTALIKLTQWYKAYFMGNSNILEITQQQIMDYMKGSNSNAK